MFNERYVKKKFHSLLLSLPEDKGCSSDSFSTLPLAPPIKGGENYLIVRSGVYACAQSLTCFQHPATSSENLFAGLKPVLIFHFEGKAS
jgi:hypothetical protein